MAVVVAAVSEVLGAGWTLEGSLAGMDALMSLKKMDNHEFESLS